MAVRERQSSPYRSAVERLAQLDPDHDSQEELLARLGAVLDELPGLADRRWELVLAMESVLTEPVSPGLGPAKVIADLQLERAIRADARHAVLSQPMLTAEAVARALGSSSVNPRQYANTRRRRSELLGLPVKNRFLFPAFQLDLERCCVYPVVCEVNGLLGASEDPWGVASWWFSPNGWLQSDRPADHVHDEESTLRVLQAAQAVVAPLG
jgi:hypothetical protein